MRDIKFRAFNGDRIVKVNTIGWTEGEIDWVDTSKNDDFDEDLILMQYTGKKDINSVEIYEGDIVNNGQHTYLVCFGEFTDSDDFQELAKRQTGFYLIDTHTDEKFPFYSLMYRVIGNIYEKPELLED